MNKKNRTVFVCSECGSQSPKWQGQCDVCGAWNTLIEEKLQPAGTEDRRRRTGSSDAKDKTEGRALSVNRPNRLADVKTDTEKRTDTGIKELNRVLGGGIVRGSLVLISGEPGIGKSTLIIQAAANIARSVNKVLYVSGEESEEQIKLRADRVCRDLGDNVYILSETSMENILAVTDELKPDFIVIDSIQTMYTEELQSAPGSVSQVRACGNDLMRVGKEYGIPVFIVAHVTKSGELAGPKTVEHLVDCVLYFTGERSREFRILRAVKNRFGNTSEIGAFEMTQEGLRGIENLSKVFLEGMTEDVSGSVASAVYEGTRPLLLEVQALTAKSGGAFGRRTAVGIDSQRLGMIIAVLERKAQMSLTDQDVYVNIVGGLKPEGISMDLAVAVAIHTAYHEKMSKTDTIVIGEIGLTGELRSVQHADRIVKEAARMGFRRIIMPKSNAAAFREVPEGMTIVGVRHVVQALERY